MARRSRRRRIEDALIRLAELREGLRGKGNAHRAGRFSCDGCVAWCCREESNSMRATPLEAEAVARFLEARGPEAVDAARRRIDAVIAAADLDAEAPADGGGGRYTCPFLDAGRRCGVHPVKPLGCVTFTPVRDGGCDQDADLLAEALDLCADLNDVACGSAWRDLPFPVAVREALRRSGSARPKVPGDAP